MNTANSGNSLLIHSAIHAFRLVFPGSIEPNS